MKLSKQQYALYLIMERSFCCKPNWQETLKLALAGGVTLVQLREKTASTREFLNVGKEVQALLQPYAIPLIVNDRIDIALALNAEGVHLGQNDMPYLEARKILGPNKTLGITINSIQQAQQAIDWDVDYLGVGPVFATTSKLDLTEPLSLAGLKKIRQITSHPIVAIGGINSDNAKSVLAVGVQGIAVVSAICGEADPLTKAQQLIHLIKSDSYEEIC